MNLTRQPADFRFTYDLLGRQLHGTWAGPVLSTDMQRHYLDLLTAARTCGHCRFWLLDLRRRNWHDLEFPVWFNEVYVPAVHAALGQSVFIAYVLDATGRAVADNACVQDSQRSCAAYDVYPYFFDNPDDAQAWLTYQQTGALALAA